MGYLVSLAAPAAMVVVLLLVRTPLLRPLTGFGVFLVLWLAGGLVALIGAVRAFRANDQSALLVHAAIAVILLGTLGWNATSSRAPAIHDVTTDPIDPPEFLQAISLPGNQGRDLSYPHGGADVPELQAAAYPDLEPLRVAAAPDRTLEAARSVATDLGWEVTWSNTRLGRLEAWDQTTLFRFVDDVTVRIRPDGDGSVVDVRSTSRVGRSDLGTNARRIRRFLRALETRLSEGGD